MSLAPASGQRVPVRTVVGGGGRDTHDGHENSPILVFFSNLLGEEHGLGPVFFFTGHLEDPRQFLAAADIYVLSSRRHDAFPTVVPEAMAAGKAIVATRSGGCEEAVEDGVMGRLVPMRDPNSMARAICDCLLSFETVQRMGDAGKRKAERLYAPAAMAQGYLSSCERAIEVFRARRRHD